MNVAAPAPKANMGQPAPRLDARLKVTGEAHYPSDFPVKNAAYAFLVTSAIAKGRITRLDLDAARSVPGVLDILTAEHTNKLKPVEFSTGASGASTSIQNLGPEIAHDGQIIAMVVADSYEAAREAAYKVEAAYEADTPSPSARRARARRTSLRTRSRRRPAMPTRRWRRPTWCSMPNTARRRSITIRSSCSPPPAVERRELTTVCEAGSRFVHGTQEPQGECAEMEADKVHVVSPYVGGAFGSKAQLPPRTALVALAAKRLKRPVKLVATRDQGFTITTYRAEMPSRFSAARRDGKIVGYSSRWWTITWPPTCLPVNDSARM